jgi:hypothetical protein
MARRNSDVCDERFGITYLRKRDQNPWQETLAPPIGLNLPPTSRVAFMLLMDEGWSMQSDV